ncbi:MAG TPA: PadR family transcriptional regulator [Phycisphaerales bacterium]|nr:PadR family transcriptional regulator [Phycisphaerales bacterium]
MSSPTPELLQGTLDVMILSVLKDGPLHGYAIARRIERASGGELAIEEGSLYPALHRLSKRGDLDADWGETDTGRRARFYTLTRQGHKRLAEQASLWVRVSTAVNSVLGVPGTPDPAGETR